MSSQGRDERVALARTWARAIGSTVYVPMSAVELHEYLLDLITTLFDTVAAEPFTAAPAAELGRRLVRAKFTGHETLQQSIAVLSDALLAESGSADRVVAMMGELAAGYAEAIRGWTLDQQEEVKRALLDATRRSEAELRESENRFREVVTSSALGIAITDLEGKFLQTNPALAEIIGCKPADFEQRVLTDLFSVATRGQVANAFRADGPDRMITKAELVKDDGDEVWANVALSLLRDDDDAPSYLVAMVQDNSELELLQRQIETLTSKDGLTGMHNRQFFKSRVESVLGRAAPGHAITLLHIDIDNFSVVNHGFGYEAGDELLVSIADKLQRVFADEKAEFGRIDGDEFAVLVENGPTTPSTEDMIRAVHAELAEPVYLGEHGIAVGASIGAVGRLWSTDAVEFFGAAQSALRKAKRSGLRQWSDYDKPEDATEKADFERAAMLAGAFETGEVTLDYSPVVRLSDRKGVGVLAGVVWQPRDAEVIAHDDCVRLAELTGLSVQVGPWLLGEACGHLPIWQALAATANAKESVLRVRLSRAQSADGDLVAAVNEAVARSAVGPEFLQIAFDTSAVAEGLGTAPDNLFTVASNGVRVALHSFRGGPLELDLLAGSEARSVVLTDVFGDVRPPQRSADSALVLGTVELVRAVARIGAEVCVDGVRDEEEAAWWSDHGVHTATGLVFGDPGDVHDMMARFSDAG
ncbi:GGDEF domain-containing protein [Labedaea rhizosphaerae]|uniref:PAS domain S-box-containing protein/diguanylate cyclase (GGDEF)-like protein n=1 Tax=Labedaea rhizosphaerae TaxID=598644 RepID=A0A4R6S2U9_LABRH|nr:diguanylate cyclase [Labedaea rhizosphaerae]TDP93920.1 PAS domain S-box-containing protein/diguanylate cyclase (GGDEF)-like protein [Labedaea rhizosphaerae]